MRQSLQKTNPLGLKTNRRAYSLDNKKLNPDIEYNIQKSLLIEKHQMTQREKRTREKIQKVRREIHKRRKRLIDNRVIVQLMSGQKVRSKDFNPKMLNMTNYDFNQKISKLNDNLKNPKIFYLNKWNDVTSKSRKYCKMILPEKVIKKQERLIKRLSKENLRRKGKKQIRTRSLNNTGKLSDFFINENISFTDRNASFNLTTTKNFHIENKVKEKNFQKKNFVLRNGRIHPLKRDKKRTRNLLLETSKFSLNRSFRRKNYDAEKKEDDLNEYKKRRNSFLNRTIKTERSKMFNSHLEGRKTSKGIFSDFNTTRNNNYFPEGKADYEKLSKKSKLYYDDLEQTKKYLKDARLSDVSSEKLHSLTTNEYFKYLYNNSKIVKEYFDNTGIEQNQKSRKPDFKRLVLRPKRSKGKQSLKKKIGVFEDDSRGKLSKEMDDMDRFLKQQREKRGGFPQSMNGRRFQNIFGEGPYILDRAGLM